MEKTLLILILGVFAPIFGHGRACTFDETQLGCKTTPWHHCYSKLDCTLSCSSPHHKTGDIKCCSHRRDGTLICSGR